MTGSARKELAIISVLDAADGNPLMAAAVQGSLSVSEQEVLFVALKHSGWLAGAVHRSMTKRAKRNETYTKHSEQLRTGYAGLLFGYIAWVELLQSLRQSATYKVAEKRNWHVIQEFQLLAASPKWVNSGRFNSVRVLVPDTVPKRSAIRAVQKHSQRAVFEVWNSVAAKQLQAVGVPVELVHPYILAGTVGYKQIKKYPGVPIIVKASGSGMAVEWQQQLQETLQPHQWQTELHFSGRIVNRLGQEIPQVSAKSRRERFLTALGYQTRLIIGYPSELVQIVAEMQSLGIPVRLVALPPRGGHELHNLEIGYNAGLIAGTLGQQILAGVPFIQLAEILDHMQSQITLQTDFLGP